MSPINRPTSTKESMREKFKTTLDSIKNWEEVSGGSIRLFGVMCDDIDDPSGGWIKDLVDCIENVPHETRLHYAETNPDQTVIDYACVFDAGMKIATLAFSGDMDPLTYQFVYECVHAGLLPSLQMPKVAQDEESPSWYLHLPKRCNSARAFTFHLSPKMYETWVRLMDEGKIHDHRRLVTTKRVG